jgi:hypothetical protein
MIVEMGGGAANTRFWAAYLRHHPQFYRGSATLAIHELTDSTLRARATGSMTVASASGLAGIVGTGTVEFEAEYCAVVIRMSASAMPTPGMPSDSSASDPCEDQREAVEQARRQLEAMKRRRDWLIRSRTGNLLELIQESREEQHRLWGSAWNELAYEATLQAAEEIAMHALIGAYRGLVIGGELATVGPRLLEAADRIDGVSNVVAWIETLRGYYQAYTNDNKLSEETYGGLDEQKFSALKRLSRQAHRQSELEVDLVDAIREIACIDSGLNCMPESQAVVESLRSSNIDPEEWQRKRSFIPELERQLREAEHALAACKTNQPRV